MAHAPNNAPPPLSSASRSINRVLLWLGPWSAYALITIIPLAFIIAIYGVVPVGDPDSTRFREQAVLLFVVTPALFTALAYAYSSVFFAGIDGYRPFRASLLVEGLVWAATLAVLGPLVRFLGTFNLYGAAAYFLALFTTIVGVLLSHLLTDHLHRHKRIANASLGPAQAAAAPSFLRLYKKYLWVELMLVLETVGLVGYIFAFRYAPDGLQAVLPAFLRVSVFIWRTALLPLTDFLTLEVAMLVALYWTSNLMDFFLLVVFPVVKKPSAFAAIWATYFLANVFNLFFFVDAWFGIRLWIKSTLKGYLTCTPVVLPAPDDAPGAPDDRGHGTHRLGYQRRQTRAFLYRMMSQLIAAAFYLAISPVLRFALNKEYFLVGRLDAAPYEHSMIFVASNLGFQLITLAVGVFVIRAKAPVAFSEVIAELRASFTNLRFLGCIAAITSSNALICTRENLLFFFFETI